MEFRDACLGDQKKTEGRCLLIAEVAQTHDGSLGQAHAFVDAVANAGADAIKFQTHIASAESTPQEPWRVKFSPQDDTRFEYWRRMEFSKEQWAGLKEHAEEKGLLFISSPFSNEAFDLLSEIGMSVWKIASGEVSNSVLIDKIVATKDPVILSTGMSSWDELETAVERIKLGGNRLAVLQCTSSYPCPPQKVGLNLLSELKSAFDCAVGLSDHSGNIFSGLAAATLGAEVLEIHVTLSPEMFGPDVPASITTRELAQLTTGVRWIEGVMENPVDKEAIASELQPLRKIFSKSVYASTEIKAGTVLTQDHLCLKKPGTGLEASRMPELIGKRLARDVGPDEHILLSDVESSETKGSSAT